MLCSPVFREVKSFETCGGKRSCPPVGPEGNYRIAFLVRSLSTLKHSSVRTGSGVSCWLDGCFSKFCRVSSVFGAIVLSEEAIQTAALMLALLILAVTARAFNSSVLSFVVFLVPFFRGS